MIPKIIWQTHNYEYNNLPDNFLKATKTWKYLNPGWEYVYVSSGERENFIKKELPDIYDFYMSSEPAFQSDLWRYLVVCKNGGVYADMDSVCIKPLDYMLKNYNGESLIHLRPYVGSGGESGYINNSHFAAVKNSKILQDIVKLNYLFIKHKKTKLDVISWISYAAMLNIQNQNNSIFFDAELHSHELKKYFFDFRVDYYGEFIKYSEYLKHKISLNSHELKASLPPESSSYCKVEKLPPDNVAYIDNVGFIGITNINKTTS